MAVLAVLLLLLLLVGRGEGGMPECSTDTWQCNYAVDTTFAQAMRMEFDGKTAELVGTPELIGAFCNATMWKMRSEMCYPCPVRLVVTQPARLSGAFICLRDNRFAPYELGQHMDLGHELNGKELDIVTADDEHGCDESAWTGDYAGKMVMVRGGATCSVQTQFRAAAKRGASVGLWVSPYTHRVVDWAVIALSGSSVGFENLLGYTMSEQYGNDMFAELKAGGRVRGKVTYTCDNVDKGRDMSEYYTNGCPWWIIGNKCNWREEEEHRLCMKCPMEVVDEGTGDKVCFWGNMLLPARRKNFFDGVLSFPTKEEIVFLTETEGCEVSDWKQAVGKIAAFSPPQANTKCLHFTAVMQAEAAGVKGVLMVTPKGWYAQVVQGPSEPVNIPVGASAGTEAVMFRDIMARGQAVPGGYARTLTLRSGTMPPAVPTRTTTEKPIEVPVVEPESSSLTSEAGFAVCIALMVVAVALVAVHGVVQGTKRYYVPKQWTSGTTLSLGAASMLLSVALLVAVVAITYSLVHRSGQEGLDTAVEDGERALGISNQRNLWTTETLTRQTSAQLVQSALAVVDAFMDEGRNGLKQIAALMASDDSSGYGWATFWRKRDSLWRMMSERYTQSYMDDVWLYSVLTQEGFFADSQRTNDPSQLGGWRGEANGTEQAERVRDAWGTGFVQRVLIANRFDLTLKDSLEVPRDMWDGRFMAGKLFLRNGETLFDRVKAEGSRYFMVQPYAHTAHTEYCRGVPVVMYQGIASYSGKQITGAVAAERRLDELSRILQGMLDAQEGLETVGNLTLAVWSADGYVLATNHWLELWNKVDVLGRVYSLAYNTERDETALFGYELLSWRSTRLLEVNAMVNVLEAQAAEARARDEKPRSAGTVEFRQEEKYDGDSWVLMGMDFEGGVVRDSSWAPWKTEVRDGWCSGASCTVASGGARNGGGALKLDGASNLYVYTNLTTDHPRVVSARASGEGRATLYSRSVRYADGTEVVVRRENHLSNKTGPVLRDAFTHYSSYSVAVFLKPDAAISEDTRGTAPRVISDSIYGDAALRLWANGALKVSVLNYGCKIGPAKGGIPAGRWTHLVATVDFRNLRCRVYVNGEVIGESEMPRQTETMKLPVSTEPWIVGGWYAGLLDEFLVLNHSLTPEGVRHLYRTGEPQYVPPREWVGTYGTLGGGANWVTAVLIPKDDITRETDRFNREVQRNLEVSSQNTQNELDRKSEMTVLVIAVVSMFTVLIFLVLNALMTEPFKKVAERMAAIALMDVDEEYTARASLITEIGLMNRAMARVLANLREYKSYMPKSMLEQLDSESEEDVASSRSKSKGSVYQSGTSKGSTSASNSDRAAVAAAVVQLGVNSKRVSLLVTNMVGFHAKVHGKTDVVQQHSDYINAVLHALVNTRGVPDTFSGDRVFASFNGVKSTTGHAEAAVRALLDVRTTMRGANVAITCGVSTGSCQVGNIGVPGMKRYSYLGPIVSWVYALERFAKSLGVSNLVDNKVSECTMGVVTYRHHGLVMYTKFSETPHAVREATELIDVVEDEWMYQLEEAQKKASATSMWNSMVTAVLAGEFGKADKEMEALKSDNTFKGKSLEIFDKAIKDKDYTPLPPTFD